MMNFGMKLKKSVIKFFNIYLFYGGRIMKKTELISTVAEKCEVKKQDAEKIINAVLDTIVMVRLMAIHILFLITLAIQLCCRRHKL